MTVSWKCRQIEAPLPGDRNADPIAFNVILASYFSLSTNKLYRPQPSQFRQPSDDGSDGKVIAVDFGECWER
jgi:hypothetical protein